MKLSQNEINFYHENGYLIIDGLFSQSEVQKLDRATSTFKNLKDLPNVILETSGSIRSIFAPHQHSPEYNDLYRNERLINPSKQLLDSDIYLYQFKLNNKQAFEGDWWEWHQDFPYWNIDDGVKNPQMISAMILMQDTSSLQGPLVVIPKSHKNGILDFEPKEHLALKTEANSDEDFKDSLSADLKYTGKKELVKQLIDENGFVEVVGKIGTCCFFHPNLFHASNANISP